MEPTVGGRSVALIMNDVTSAPRITCAKCKRTATFSRQGDGFEVPKGWETIFIEVLGDHGLASHHYEGTRPVCLARKK